MDIKTVLSKPLPVVWFRFVQLVKLKFYLKIGFWEKTEIKTSKQFKNTSKIWRQESKLFAQKPKRSISDTCSIKKADEIIKGFISIFDVTYEMPIPFLWNIDWRYQKTWKNKYFKEYSFYEKEKKVPYDVKFPWELSRLSFLIPVARAFNSCKDSKYSNFIFETLTSWKSENPIANSVNWYPMEVSVRTINLIQLRELLLHSKNTNKTIQLLNEILILHGIFLWRNIEYTDVRGNHYSANLTALLLLGITYKQTYKEAKKWFNFTIKKTEKEFYLQFISDGVNFEKSISYHRLVVEFYFISFLVMERINLPVNKKTIDLFHKACLFIKDYTKPNQLTPIIGDNDSASVFQNDEVTLNNHSNILQLASVFLNDNSLNISSTLYDSVVDLFGNVELKEIEIQNSNGNYYKEGGFFIVKNSKNYFITDVGEVGMNGKGGHGHNDLFSFELMYDNNDLIVDSGCFTYTGDLDLKNKMKISEYHNGLIIDNEEIAPLIGNWEISNVAKPYDVVVKTSKESYIISGKHSGYSRLEDPIEHERVFEIRKKGFKLICTDTIICKSAHEIKRSIHFSEKVKLEIKNKSIFATYKDVVYQIKASKTTELGIKEYLLSYNYGLKTPSKKVVLQDKIKGVSTLYFSIEKNEQE